MLESMKLFKNLYSRNNLNKFCIKITCTNTLNPNNISVCIYIYYICMYYIFLI